ncbi:MAG: putative lipid II flippase FtsW [Desulfobacterales bacterium]|nr:putative lipid II flippase FtsW [Desulfobacterales bacterium]
MADRKAVNPGYDYMILLPVISLVSLGLVIVYSASSHMAATIQLQDSYFYLKRQALFCVIGIGLMIFAKNIPCILYSKLVYLLMFVSFCLLMMLFVPGFGHKVGGAVRWLRWGEFSFQPSELAKFSLAVYMAYSMSKKHSNMQSFSKGLLPHMVIAGAFMSLIILQPDLGTSVIIGFWLLIILFVGGVKIIQLTSVMAMFSLVVGWLIIRSGYRLDRLQAFKNPWDDPQGVGFQIIHSFMAFGSGGIFGTGLGSSKQKLGYLPESHTDFVLSVAAEELGFLGVAVIIVLFAILILRGIKIALDAKDLYSCYLALGITCLMGLQVCINMCVVMGLLPTKGLSLPIISYGGSSLVLNLFCAGVLMNISSGMKHGN